LSEFKEWNQLKHAQDHLLFAKNIGKHLSLDETALSHGELYTILTNKSAKGKAGTIVAIVAGTSYEKVAQSGFKSFNTISRTIMNHYKTILNYFDNRSTNASAESFNAKIKAFRAQFRGVRNVEFFLFRLTQIYA
jgi:transposase